MSKKTTDVYKKTNEQYVERREFQMKKIADFIVDKRKYVMILYLIILVLSVVGMLHVNVNYDMSKYLPRQNKRMNGYSLIAIQLFGEFVNGI